MSKIKISIITVCYNSSETIEDTIKSIASQTYKNVEYIIVDGASKDNTLDIVKSYNSIVTKFISEKDNGIYDAMNKGIQLASGDVIGILNADDVLNNEFILEKVAKVFEDESVDASYGDLKYVRKDDLTKVVRFWKSGVYSEGKFYYGWMPPHPTFYVRKSIYSNLGLYRTDMPSASDYELMLRFIHVNKIRLHYIEEVIVLMREGGLSNRSFKHRLDANRDDRRAWTINGIQPKFYTLFLKPLSKLLQFVLKD